MPNKKCTQDSHKTAQEFCVGFENWGLVRTRLARARNENKSCANGLVRTRLQKKYWSCAHKALAQDLAQDLGDILHKTVVHTRPSLETV